MARSMWSGAIAWGLVAVPVKMYPATGDDEISMHQVHRKDGSRIQFRRVCQADGEEVPWADIARGYELANGDMVVLTDEDLEQLPLPTRKTIAVSKFIPAGQVAPIAYNKPYYLEPQLDVGGLKPYTLLREALAASGREALCRVTLRTRESLALLRPEGKIIVMHTLSWPNEIRAASFRFTGEDVVISDSERVMAGMLVDALAGDYDPAEQHSDYAEALFQMVQAKVAGRQPAAATPDAPVAPVLDLGAVLQASIAAVKAKAEPEAA